MNRPVMIQARKAGWEPPKPSDFTTIREDWIFQMCQQYLPGEPLPSTPQASMQAEALLFLRGVPFPGDERVIQEFAALRNLELHHVEAADFSRTCPKTGKVFTSERDWDLHLRVLADEMERGGEPRLKPSDFM